MGKQTDSRPFFARRLEELRREKKPDVSQYLLSQLSGLSKQAISQFEKGTRQPTWDAVQKLAAALELPTDEFRDPSIVKHEVEPKNPGRPKKEESTE